MIFPRSRNKPGREWSLPVLAIAAALLSSGCVTAEKNKTGGVFDPAPAKKAPAHSEAAAQKKAPAIPESSTAKKTSPLSNTGQGNAARNAAQTALTEGIDLYDKGQFNAAIKRLNAPEILYADTFVQTKALKYKAFSYCVTSRKVLCRRQFDKALKLDPRFDLEPGEKGHPLWGAVFDRAKPQK